MTRIFLSIMASCAFSMMTAAQSFTNIDELLQLSEMDPLECEKLLTSKGFKFQETDGLKSSYSKAGEAVSYRVSPRRAHYMSTSRTFFLEVNSRLIKQGFVLANSEGVLEDKGTTIKAQEYQKGKFTVWLYIDKETDQTYYNVQVDNSDPSSVKKAPSTSGKSTYNYKGDKEPVNYGYFSLGLILPRGIIAEAPKATSTYNQDYTGQSGLGAKAGFESSVGGVLGITPLNKVLPHALDFGIILNGQFGMQPYSYKSLGNPYDDYTYNSFMKAGAGAGPAVVLTPFRESDFHISFYYKVEAGLNFDGGFRYSGTASYEETLKRDAVSFAWVKSYGIHIFGGGVFGGVEFSNYTDKGTFNYDQSYFVNNTYVN